MTKRPWHPEINVTSDTVQAVVSEQLPHLASESISLLGYGWDNDAYLVGSHILRFPRRHFAVKMVAFEAAILRLLPLDLPLEVPRLEHFGSPSDAYPYEFLVYQMVKGTPACDMRPVYDLTSEDAAVLGDFLRQVHCIPVSISETIRGDTMRKGDTRYRLGKIEAAVAVLPDDALDVPKAEVLHAAAKLAETEPTKSTSLVHGDLYARHVLVDEDQVSGVIDWGDAHVGDPALDLSIAYTLLSQETAQPFFESYGEIDDATRRRAMFRALFYAAVIAEFGISNNDESILWIGQFAARRVLESI